MASVPSSSLTKVLVKLDRLDLTGNIEVDTNPTKCGASFDVFRGRLRVGGKGIAVRQLRVHLRSQRKYSKRVARELLIWVKIRHPNIIPLLGYALLLDDGQFPVFITEWMENGTIRAYLEANPDINILPLIKGIAEGLRYLHSKGVVHADVKADNVLVSEAGDALLADFGLSHYLETLPPTENIITPPTTTISSTTASMIGTTRWMAIELLVGNADGPGYSVEADVWAFAMTVYEILTRKLPYHELMSDAQVTLEIIAGKLPTCPGKLDTLNEHEMKLWKLSRQCWKSDPKARPSMERVVDIVNAWNDWNGDVMVRLVTQLTTKSYITCLKFSPDGKLLAIGLKDGISIFDVERQKIWALQAGQILLTKDCKFSFNPSGSLLAATAKRLLRNEWAQQILILDVSRRFVLKAISIPRIRLNGLVFSYDGLKIIAGCHDGNVYTWDARTGTNAKTVLATVRDDLSKQPAICSVALSPDGKLLVAGTDDARVHVWNVETRERLVFWSTRKGSVNDVVIAPDGRAVLTGGSDKAVKIWRFPSSEQATRDEALVEAERPCSQLQALSKPGFASAFRDHTDSVRTVSVSRDGQWALSGSVSGTVWLWELQETEEQCKFKLASSWSADFSPTADLFATCGGGGVKIWSYARTT